jgi:hypothetical protein
MNTIYKRCARGHILGQIRHNDDGLAMLELFRQAIDYGQDMPEQVDVIAVVTAGHGIRCSVCGGVVDFRWKRRHDEREK